MQFWAINAIAFLIYSLIFYKFNKKELYLFVAFIHLGVILAFRDITIGTDTSRYSFDYLCIANKTFKGSSIIPLKSALHYYFLLTSKLLKGRNGYMIATAIPTLFSIYLLLKKYSKNYFVSICLYLGFYNYFYTMNMGRQFLGIASTIFAFILANEKKYFFSFICYFLAIWMHNSTIIFGVYYLINMITWNITLFNIFMIIAVTSSISINYFLKLFIYLFPKYQWVIKTEYIYEWVSSGRSSLVITLYCIMTIIIALYWIYRYEGKMVIVLRGKYINGLEKYDEDSIQLMFRMMCMLLIVAAIDGFYPRIILFTRISYTLFIYIIVLLANVLENIEKHKIIIEILLLFPLFIFMYAQLAGNYSSVLNYKFY